jgi:hypothetical protein
MRLKPEPGKKIMPENINVVFLPSAYDNLDEIFDYILLDNKKVTSY